MSQANTKLVAIKVSEKVYSWLVGRAARESVSRGKTMGVSSFARSLIEASMTNQEQVSNQGQERDKK